MEKLENIIFYALERAIKSYRQYAQHNITAAGIDITIDQWLLLKAIQENPGAPQSELAKTVFKDMASVTRMIELMVTKGFLVRSINSGDRRRSLLDFTKVGLDTLEVIQPVIENNKNTALSTLNENELLLLEDLLRRITQNTAFKPASSSS
ncbi:MarR family winged helix-turn-helix transcriptional regulator [Pedobacter sp. GSP4]|uniref:MarR family winged helix-turn-helix transcriptional regulator n=1 Tax=Pedobacter sp. GSP4 TaxID=3453716 RepID=UPI003EEC29B1